MFQKLVSSLLLALLLATSAHADDIITGSKPYTFVPGTTISSSQVNANFDYIINQVDTNAAKNGVNSSITALLGLTTPIPISAGGSSVYYATTVGGTGDAITVTATTPAISSFSLVAGVSVIFTPTATNTISGPTLNVNGTGAIILKRVGSTGVFNLRPGEIPFVAAPNTGIVWATYDGAQWVVMNPIETFGGSQTIASAATTDLGLAGSRYANITGTTTITSFGSTCNINIPIYLVRFSGAITLTYNVTSLILPGASNLLMGVGDTILAECLGGGNWRVISVFYSTPVFALGATNGLTITNNSGTPTTQIDVTTTGLSALEGVSTFATDIIGPLTKTINAATTGINGLDTGALANNTWYHIYLISDGGLNAQTLLSTSATAPTMPATYTHKLRVGAVRTLGAATFVRFLQKGNSTRYRVVTGSTTPNIPLMISGASGSTTVPTWTAVATGSYVPPTAIKIDVMLSSNSGTAMAAPNNNYGAFNSASNPPPMATNALNDTRFMGEFMLESTDVFYAASDATGDLSAVGWTDAVNAN